MSKRCIHRAEVLGTGRGEAPSASGLAGDPIGCDPARPDRSGRPQPAGRLINVNAASQAELEAHPRPDDGCRALVDRALDGDGRDSITVVLASYTIPEVSDTADRPARPGLRHQSVDHTEARNDILGCFGRSDRSRLERRAVGWRAPGKGIG
jgi:hypothetical protein